MPAAIAAIGQTRAPSGKACPAMVGGQEPCSKPAAWGALCTDRLRNAPCIQCNRSKTVVV
ncbi:hypothetical protein XOC_1922 [Xanthomonas oryzae pv. oryzicola BLS256]|uniref:Uncharacterized protein n=1 Tax=Xanthomonas oryzae pv. oryzicola (strain BLS256) TaxID=383407 RepID=G7TAW4_XANOB|nr:hypothetical protein XOC_1922 [Xanthomonas oryzae pv. oryzicola BLS256]